MAASHISGPSVVFGNAGSRNDNPEAGPSITYQGDCILDPRQAYQPGVSGVGTVRSFLDSPYIASVDAVPSTLSATAIAASQAATSGTALTLASANTAAIGVNFPIVNASSGISVANTLKVLALDPGFVSFNTTSGSAVATISAANQQLFSRLAPGLALLVGAGTNAWTPCRVRSVSGLNITLDTPMPATNAAAQVTMANAQFRSNQNPLVFTPFLTAGTAAVFDPRSGLTRGVSVTTAGSNTAGVVTVSGYDIFGYPMSEAIACATASTFYGNKCFKFITSAVPSKSGGGAMTGNISVGTSDLFGFNTRSDAYEYTSVFWAGAFMPSSTGWYAADTTSPATSSTKDVRGVIQASGNGPNGSGIGSSASNGSRRLQIFMSIPVDNLFFATIANSSSLFGVTQA